jgi:hypothetical protein
MRKLLSLLKMEFWLRLLALESSYLVFSVLYDLCLTSCLNIYLFAYLFTYYLIII